MPPIQQISLLLFAGLLICWTGFEVWRRSSGGRWRRMLVWGAIVAAVIAVYLLALKPSANVTTLAEVEATLGSGQPVLLEVYSEY